jgi:hypothetical protein
VEAGESPSIKLIHDHHHASTCGYALTLLGALHHQEIGTLHAYKAKTANWVMEVM